MHNTHSIIVGYVVWIFGFLGAHRFYYGKQLTGTLWFFTLGLLGVGWIVDLFLIPSMDREADFKYTEGGIDYSISWILLAFLGVFGFHRFYMVNGSAVCYTFVPLAFSWWVYCMTCLL